eukprot:gene12547-8968_t
MSASHQFCFMKDPDLVFKLVKINERQSNGTLVVSDFDSSSTKQTRVPEQDTIPVHSIDELENPPTDLIKLQHVHQATILHTLRSRFSKDQIYTSIGPILVALNPFKWIPGIYDDPVKNRYKSREWNLSDNPHVFAIAHDSFSDLQYGENQSMIISGESGAGKTEATKQALNYLAYIAGSSSGIQEKILKASPILEAWGNAKTLRNNNSSRFGKYIEVWFDGNTIIGSSNTTYILEKSRVVKQASEERNYHVFYQLLAGADVQQLSSYRLVDPSTQQPMPPDAFFYINQSGCVRIDDVDDAADHREAIAAFQEVGFSAQEVDDLFRVIAGVLQLGNVLFQTEGDNSAITAATEGWFHACAEVFHVDKELFRSALLFKKVRSGGGKRSSVALSPYSPEAAVETRDAFAKEIYRRCFDWIVSKINLLMYDDRVRPTNMIGVLDIFGFEIFKQNSFEQLCINLANEALQQHFNYHIFQAEINIYESEDVPVPPLDYKDNQDVLDMIMKRPKGLLPVLDEECMVPKGSWEGFVNKFSKQQTGNARFKYRNKAGIELGVVHYAGEVYYDPSLFLVKNKDTLAQDLVEVFSASGNRFITSLFDEVMILQREASVGSFRKGMKGDDDGDDVASPTAAPTGGRMMKRSSTVMEAKQTVGKKFSLQLESLMKNLNATKPRYIRCVKPNQQKKPNIFVNHLTNEQLTYSGVFEAVIIMQNGYPFRLDHAEFRDTYHVLVQDSIYKSLLQDAALYQAFEAASNRQLLWADERSFQPFAAPFIAQRKAKGKQHTRGPIVRKQCELMVNLIARSLTETPLNRRELFVGHTKIFYRAPEHRVLLQARELLVNKALRTLQACARRYIAYKLVKTFRKDVQTLLQAMQRRDLSTLAATSSLLAALNVRLDKVSPGVQCSVEIVRISQGYSQAMLQEHQCVAAFEATFSRHVLPPADASDERVTIAAEAALLQALLPTLETTENIHFVANYRGLEVHVVWTENAALVDFVQRVYTLQRKVHVAQLFTQSLQDENEVLLARAREELELLREQQEVPANYLRAFDTQAQTIIQQAEELSHDILTQLQTQLAQGVCHLVDASSTGRQGGVAVTAGAFSAVKDCVVDPQPLQRLLQEAQAKLAALRKPPVRVKIALHALETMVDLRTLAQTRQWEALWSKLGAASSSATPTTTASSIDPPPMGSPKWSDHKPLTRKHSNSTASNSSDHKSIPVDDANPLRHSALPRPILELLDTETHNMIIASVTFFLLPRFQEILAAPSPIPEAACLEPFPIDTTELEAQLAFAKQYQSFFDQSLTDFVLRMEEHLFLRQAVASGSRDDILRQLQAKSIAHIPPEHPDVVHAKRYPAMYDVLQQVAQLFEAEKWRGTAGQFEPSQVKYEALAAWNQRCERTAADGDGWHALLYVCQVICDWKKELSTTPRLQCAAMLDALVEIIDPASEWSQSVDQLLTFAQFPELHLGVRILLAELQTLRGELGHYVGMSNVLLAFDRDQITENIAMPLQSRTFSLLQAAIDENTPRLLPSLAVKDAILERLVTIQTLREMAVNGQYDALGAKLDALPAGFDECSGFPAAVVAQYAYTGQVLAVRARWFDYFVRKTVAERLYDREVPAIGSNACALFDIIRRTMEPTAQGTELSLTPKAKEDVLLAKAFFALRCALRDGRWEPVPLVFFGRVPTERLVDVIVKGEGDFPADAKSLDRVLSAVRALDHASSTERVDQRIRAVELGDLCVSDLLAWFEQRPELADAALEEIRDVQRQGIDRRVRAIILLAVTTGRFTGNLDKVNHRTVRLDELRTAVTYCRLNVDAMSSVARGWLAACEMLLKLREIIVKVYSDVKAATDPTWKDTLHESIHVEDIQALIAAMTADGFPVDELQLILDKIIDLKAFEELEQALTFGAPTFVNGKFDLSRLQYDHLVERLDTAKKVNMQRRSDRLDRFFFYLELVINLRTALSANQWDLSERGSDQANKRSALDRYVITVKRCLAEYEQAQRFFRTPLPGVPPPLVIDEFALVAREWERRLTIQRFHHALKTGAITGTPFHLVIHDARTDLLEAEIQRAASMEAASGEVDRDVQMYVQAAKELVALRKTALETQKQYRSHCQFGKQTNSIRAILGEQAFLPDCISKAVHRIDEIRKSKVELRRYPTAPLDALIQDFRFCTKLPLDLPEVTLLQMDYSERCFTNEVLTYVAAIDSGVDVDANMRQALTNLQHTFSTYYQRTERLTAAALSGGGATRKSGITGAVVRGMGAKALSLTAAGLSGGGSSGGSDGSKLWASQFLHDSALFLVHYLRAKTQDLYDHPDRDWKRDVNLENTPRVTALQKNLKSGRYTMQQVIRAAYKCEIHHKVAHVLRTAEAEIEDRISHQELETALSQEGLAASGSIGRVVIPDIALSYPESVLTRIETVVGSRTGHIKQLKVLLECIYTMRLRLHEHKFLDVLTAAAKFIRVGQKDLAFMASILYESSDGLSVGIARKEFFLLAKEACDRLWQTQLLDIVLKGGVRGSRGAVAAFAIQFEEIQPMLQVAETMTEKSAVTQHWARLAETVYLLRFKFLDLFSSASPAALAAQQAVAAGLVPTTGGGSGGSGSGAAGHDDTVVFLPHAHLDGGVAKLLEDGVNAGVTNVLELGSVNWNVSIARDKAEELLDYLLDVRDQLRATAAQLLPSTAARSPIAAGGASALSPMAPPPPPPPPVALIEDHVRFLLGVQQLVRALEVPFFTLEKDGLLLQASFADLADAARQMAQLHLQAQRPSEQWVAHLLRWSERLVAVMEQVEAVLQRRTNLVLEPGSTEFAAFCPFLTSFLQFHTSLFPSASLSMLPAAGQQSAPYPRTGVQKFVFPTEAMRRSLVAMSDAVRDHSTVLMLHSIVFADRLLWYEQAETHQWVVTVKRMHAIPFVIQHGVDAGLIDVAAYADEVDFLATSIRDEFDAPKTSTSQELVTYTLSLLQFRCAVMRRQWLQAQTIVRHLAETTSVHTNTKDFETFQHFLTILRAKRQMEYELLLSMALPEFAYWSLLQESGVAVSSMGRGLERFMRGLVDGSVERLPTLKIFEALTEVSYQVVEVTKALRTGLWISAADLADHPKHRLFLDAVVREGEQVTAPWYDAHGGEYTHSVFAALMDLQQRLQHCQSIGHYLRAFLQRKMQQLHREFVVVQLEHVVTTALGRVTVLGQPGELVFADQLTALHQVVALLDKPAHRDVVEHCHRLRQGYLTVKALYGVFASHRRGDVEQLIDYVNILIYCHQNGRPPGLLERKANVRVKALTQSFTSASDEEFESVFSEPLHLFVERPAATLDADGRRRSTAAKQSGRHVLFDRIVDGDDADADGDSGNEASGDPVAAAAVADGVATVADEEDARVEEADDMNREITASIAALIGIRWQRRSQIPAVRSEVASLVPLLEQHCLFESLYSDYEKAMRDAPAAGHPGEDEALAGVRYESLERLLPLFSVFPQLQQPQQPTSYVTLLYTAAVTLHLVRQSQVFGDTGGVRDALQLWRDGLANESDYEAACAASLAQTTHGQSVSLFGGRAKTFCRLAQAEMAFAEEDVQQRFLIATLREALAHPPGVVDDWTADQSHVEIESLVEACKVAQRLGAKCPTAAGLYDAARHLYKLRRHVAEKQWPAVLDAVLGGGGGAAGDEAKPPLYDAAANTWRVAANAHEFETAWKIAATAQVTALVEAAYRTGRISSKIFGIKSGAPPTTAAADATTVAPPAADASAAADAATATEAADGDEEAVSSEACAHVVDVAQRVFLLRRHDHAAASTAASASAAGSSRQLWVSGEMQRHLRSCRLLLELRTLFLTGQHDQLLDRIVSLIRGRPRPPDEAVASTPTATDDDRATSAAPAVPAAAPTPTPAAVEDEFWAVYDLSDLSPQCQAEIASIKSRAAYAVVMNLFRAALATQSLRGEVGHVDASALSVTRIVDTSVRAWQIGFQHEDVLLMQRSAGFVYRLRQAQRRNRWLRDAVTDVGSAAHREAPYRSLLVERLVDTSVASAGEPDLVAADDLRLFRAHCLGGPVGGAEDAATEAAETEEAAEFVEDLFGDDDWAELQRRLSLHAATAPELRFAFQELRYRQIVVSLLQGVYSAGYTGTPGDVQDEDADGASLVETAALERAIALAMRHPELTRRDECYSLLRDAKLLLAVRQCRLHDDFAELNDAILRAEEHNLKVLELRVRDDAASGAADTAAATAADDLRDGSAETGAAAATAAVAATGAVATAAPLPRKGAAASLQPILPKVWEEIKLLKYDALFQLALAEFSAEMTRDEDADASDRDVDEDAYADEDAVLLRHGERIANLRNILDFAVEAAQGFACADFDRLVEAVQMAIQLREFVRDHRGQRSPQGIIDQVAKVKLRDRKRGVTCYMTLLIYELSKLSNVLEFPVLLEQLHQEILAGKAYLRRPIGMIDYGAIKVDAMAEAYQLAKPSMEIMGTDENLAFMNLARALLDLRLCLRSGDLSAAMNVVVSNEAHLQVRHFTGQATLPSAVATVASTTAASTTAATSFKDDLAALAALAEDEVSRLRIEMENYDAGRLISHGLKTGRCLHVVAIAKMRSYFCENLAAVLAEDDSEYVAYHVTGAAGRKTRRVSAGIQQMLSMFQERYLQQAAGSVDGDDADAVAVAVPGGAKKTSYSLAAQLLEEHLDQQRSGGGGGGGASDAALFAAGGGDEVDDPSIVDPEVVDSIRASIYGLRRAVAVARRVSQMSEATRYYFRAAETILSLREGILHRRWAEVIATVQQDLDLPPIALEEVNAVREGLFLQRCVEMVAEALLRGAADGQPFLVQLELVESAHLEEIVEALEAGAFQDAAALNVIELARLVIAVRRAFVAWAQAMRHRAASWQPPLSAPDGAATASVTATATATTQELSMLDVHDRQLEAALVRVDDFLRSNVRDLLRALGVLAPNEADVVPSPFYWVNHLVDAVYAVRAEIVTMKEAVDYARALHHLRAVVGVAPLPVAFYLHHRDEEKRFLQRREARRQRRRERRAAAKAAAASAAAATAVDGDIDAAQRWQLRGLGDASADDERLSSTFPYRSSPHRKAPPQTPQAIAATESYVAACADRTSDELLADLRFAKELLALRELLAAAQQPPQDTAAGSDAAGSDAAGSDAAGATTTVPSALRSADVFALMERLRSLQHLRPLSPGLAANVEVALYAELWETADALERRLLATFAEHSLTRYPLDALAAAWTQDDELDAQLLPLLEDVKADSECVAGLVLRLPRLVAAMEDALKIRKYLLLQNRGHVDVLLRRHAATFAPPGRAGGPAVPAAFSVPALLRREYRYMAQLRQFHAFDARLRHTIDRFPRRVHVDRSGGDRLVLQQTYAELAALFTAFDALERAHARGAVDADDDADNDGGDGGDGGDADDALSETERQLQAYALLSPAYFAADAYFVAADALFALLAAVLNERWLASLQTRTQRAMLGKRVLCRDALFLEFFHVAEGSVISRESESASVQRVSAQGLSTSVAGPATGGGGGADGGDGGDGDDDDDAFNALTVFGVLQTTNWAAFPAAVAAFFDTCRSRLLELHILEDLRYYAVKGAAQLDAQGNCVLSTLYLRMLAT